VVVLNVALTLLTERFNMMIDMTGSRNYEFSNESKEFLAGMNRDITITVLCDRTGLADLSATTGYAITEKYFEKLFYDYANFSSNIKVEYVNVIKNPGYLTSINVDKGKISESSAVIVRCSTNNKYKIIDASELFLEDEYSYLMGQEAYYNIAEASITSAILIVSRENSSTAYLIEDHGEEYSDYFEHRLTNLGYNVEKIRLAMINEFTADSTVMISMAPVTDFSDTEIEIINKFLVNEDYYGKSFMLFVDTSTPELPNITEYVNVKWGIGIKENIVWDLKYQNSYIMKLDYKDEELAKSLISRDIFAYCGIGTIKEITVNTDEFENTGLFYSTESDAYIKALDAPDYNKSPRDRTGSFPVAAYSSKESTNYEIGKEILKSHVFVSGTCAIVDDLALGSPSWGNSEYFNGMMYKLTNQNIEENAYIPQKILGAVPLEIISDATTLVIFISYILLIPALIIALGLFVWFRRRHL